MLNGGGIELCADVIDQCAAYVAIVAQQANLDQLMAFQVDIDFPGNRGCQAGIADHDYGLQVMRAGLERAT